jgi:hypothetical protein
MLACVSFVNFAMLYIWARARAGATSKCLRLLSTVQNYSDPVEIKLIEILLLFSLLNCKFSVAEPLHFDAAPALALGKNFYAATAPTLLCSQSTVFKLHKR